jgi:hypothetical protein
MSFVRSWARILFFAPLALLTFSCPAFAAGSYAQSFDSSPPGWVMAEDTWSATSGYYANTNTQPFRAIAFFGDRRWTTDFTYSLRMFSDLRGTGNHKVGVVFNYVDELNYYEVAIDMRGDIQDNVRLNRMSGGQLTELETGRSTIPVIDEWFDVAIVRTGDNNVRVRIGNQDVLDYALPASPPTGYIGVLSQFNWGRFDDVKVTPVVFRTGFNTGVNITQPSPTCSQKHQRTLTGTEDGTGTVWPPAFWGAPTVVLMNTILDCNLTFSDYLDVRFKTVTSHNGESTRVLSNTVKNVTLQPDGQMGRLGLSYTVGAEGDVPYRFYVRRYLKYSSNLSALGDGTWFVQHEFKNTSCDPARRLILYWGKREGEPYYRLRMDHANSMECGITDPARVVAPDFPEQYCYPTRPGATCPEFITGQWFYDEYFVQYSIGGSSQDRVAYAINGQVIFDYPDREECPGCTVRSAKARGIKLTPGYLNIPNVEVQVDDLEIYHDAPCRTFPCGAPSRY